MGVVVGRILRLFSGSDGVVVEYYDDDGDVVIVGVWRGELLWGDGVLLFWNGWVVGGWRRGKWWRFCYG